MQRKIMEFESRTKGFNLIKDEPVPKLSEPILKNNVSKENLQPFNPTG